MDWLQKNWISLLALIVSIVAVIYTQKQSSLASRQARLHLEPEIKTYFDLPKDKNPVFVVANEGNIPAASVSVGNRVFVFDKNKRKVVTAAEMDRIFSPGAIFREVLKPTEYQNMELVGVKPQDNLIVAYEFHLKYFRESDMREYDRTDYYFIDGNQLFSHSEFIHSQFYRDTMAEIANVTMPKQRWDPGALRRYLDSQFSGQRSTVQPAAPADR